MKHVLSIAIMAMLLAGCNSEGESNNGDGTNPKPQNPIEGVPELPINGLPDNPIENPPVDHPELPPEMAEFLHLAMQAGYSELDITKVCANRWEINTSNSVMHPTCEVKEDDTGARIPVFKGYAITSYTHGDNYEISSDYRLEINLVSGDINIETELAYSVKNDYEIVKYIRPPFSWPGAASPVSRFGMSYSSSAAESESYLSVLESGVQVIERFSDTIDNSLMSKHDALETIIPNSYSIYNDFGRLEIKHPDSNLTYTASLNGLTNSSLSLIHTDEFRSLLYLVIETSWN